MASNKKPFIFIHITKTGGTSIRRCIKDPWRGGHVTAQFIWDKECDGVLYADPIEGVGYVSSYANPNGGKPFPFKRGELKSVSVVRNPYDRLVSTFYYWKRKNFERWGKVSWDEFFDYCFGEGARFYHELRNLNNDSISDLKILNSNGSVNIDLMFLLPQFWWVTHNGKIVVTDILRFENLNEEYDKWIRKYKYETDPLGNENTTKHEHYSKYFNEEQIKITQEIYKKDFDTWGYTFDKVS